jgi:antitoxin HigA-1
MLRKGIRNIHPGEILREEVIMANNLTITESARLLGVNRTVLSNILKEKSEIRPEMCIRIAAVFGGDPQIWADLQTEYNLNKAVIKMKGLHLTTLDEIKKTA